MEMFFTLFINVASLFLMMVPGFLLIRRKIVGVPALRDFSHVIIKVLYPCLIFSSVTKNYSIGEVIESWQLPVAVFLILFVGYVIGLIYTGFFSNSDPQVFLM